MERMLEEIFIVNRERKRFAGLNGSANPIPQLAPSTFDSMHPWISRIQSTCWQWPCPHSPSSPPILPCTAPLHGNCNNTFPFHTIFHHRMRPLTQGMCCQWPGWRSQSVS